jgi:hypothetical protein
MDIDTKYVGSLFHLMIPMHFRKYTSEMMLTQKPCEKDGYVLLLEGDIVMLIKKNKWTHTCRDGDLETWSSFLFFSTPKGSYCNTIFFYFN